MAILAAFIIVIPYAIKNFTANKIPVIFTEGSMNRCSRCGANIWPYQNYCTNCGQDLHLAQAVISDNSAPNTAFISTVSPAQNAAGRSIPYFIWSLILFFFFNPLGMPLAIAAPIYSTRVHAGNQDVQNLRTARLLCILSTIITGGTLLIIIIALLTRVAA